MIIGYQADKFTHTWLAEHFFSQSHINSRFMGKVSTLTHFLLEQRCKDYYFLDQAAAEFSMVFIQSLPTPSEHCNLVHPLMNLML